MDTNGGHRNPDPSAVLVVISLPPPDDPDKGKTIAAFPLTDDHRLPPTSPSLPPPLLRHHLRLHFSPKKTIAVLFGSTLLVLTILACLFSDGPYQILRSAEKEESRRETDSFLLPLYPKSGNRSLAAAPEMKLKAFRVGGRMEMWSKGRSMEFPIRGNVFPDGQYYTSLFVGNPPRPYYLDVDTGSDLTWIQCDAPCTSCAKGPHPLYKPTKGNIVPSRDILCLEVQRNLVQRYCDTCEQCDYEIEYADHSSSMGVLARDEMHLITANAELAKIDYVFGCAYDQQGQLLRSPAKTDGILGLNSAKVSLPSQLADQGIINNVIGHCISSEANHGGYMFLGDDFVPLWGMTWVHLRVPINFYSTEVVRVRYGRQRLNLGAEGGNKGQVVFDTGSSYTYFPNEAYTSLMASLNFFANGLVRDDSDPTLPVCWRTDFLVRNVKDVKQLFEPLTLQFGNLWWIKPLALTIHPEGYLIISNKGNVCLGILDGSELIDGSTIILGDISLRGKLVVYDNVQQKIGWLQSDCTKPTRTGAYPFF